VSEEKAINKHAFWLYGVLVGVAIKEALETSVSHFINPSRLSDELTHVGQRISFPHDQIGLYPEVIRLTAFLVLIVRFYLGSAFFYGAVYESETTTQNFTKTNYGADFIFGFMHFIIFVILALLIDIHTTPPHGFPYCVGLILIYDVFWYVSSLGRSTKELIFWWMIVNLITALVGAVVYLVFESKYSDMIKGEVIALWIVIGVSLLDIGLMMAKRPFFQSIGKMAPHDDMPTNPPTMPQPPDPTPD
jgi:hypothetical protein